MKTSNVKLLAEIDTLEDIKRVDASEIECVKLITKQAEQIKLLREALTSVVKTSDEFIEHSENSTMVECGFNRCIQDATKALNQTGDSND
ncbi:hypothetical protein NVP1076O_18 [Vibrio phage 1.076.O._10N.286.51.B7]|nr:hypothetical protein NVP1076O_18 [Vibrio phage 1.076.O._10N.286.51.B7]